MFDPDTKLISELRAQLNRAERAQQRIAAALALHHEATVDQIIDQIAKLREVRR